MKIDIFALIIGVCVCVCLNVLVIVLYIFVSRFLCIQLGILRWIYPKWECYMVESLQEFTIWKQIVFVWEYVILHIVIIPHPISKSRNPVWQCVSIEVGWTRPYKHPQYDSTDSGIKSHMWRYDNGEVYGLERGETTSMGNVGTKYLV